MSFDLRRLRGGEWIVGVASLALLVILFTLPWYGLSGPFSHTAATLGLKVTADGWQSLSNVRFLILVVGIGGVAVWWLQATHAAPALPVSAVVLELTLAFVLLIALIRRVLLDVPGNGLIDARSGAYASLALSAAILIGGYVSLRQDGSAADDAPDRIEILRLTNVRAGGEA